MLKNPVTFPPIMAPIIPSPTQGGGAPRARAAVLAFLAGAAALRAASLWFVNDDAFISFRYAKNLVAGLGLVYNPGERVEGFTNFLWTILVAGGMGIGVDPVVFSTALGIAFFAATVALYASISFRRGDDGAGATAAIPLGALLLVLHHDFAVYATGGLETMMVAFLVSGVFALLSDGRSERRTLLAGALMVLAMMTRPDAAVFLAASAAFLLAAGDRPVRTAALFLLPTALLFVPYWAWRASYFGFFFPNAFYAKSIALPYYGQGWAYAALFFRSYFVFLLLPLAGAVLLLARRPTAGARWPLRHALAPGSPGRGPALALLFVLVQTAFVIRIGGDFMFARFFIPVIPMLCYLCESAVARIPSRAWRSGAAAAACAAMLLRWDPFTEAPRREYIADEHRWYTREHLEQSRRDGELLRRYFRGIPVRVAFWAGQVKMIYYADPMYAIEASAGLTDTAIAHQPIAGRGRPGHEKQASTEYLAERGTHFFFGPFTPPAPGQEVLNMIVFDSIAAKIVVYDNAVMDRLALLPGVHFTPFPRYLDSYLRRIDAVGRDDLARDYASFRTYYFRHNRDDAREEPFLARLRGY
jgi:hypothetical protein